jgi:hypothetical protein
MLYFFLVINWFSLFFNTFWILGLAILLAALSYYYWQASQESRPLREQLNQPSFLKFFWLSFVFIGVGLAGTSQRAWETTIWIIFTLISAINVIKMSGPTWGSF